MKTFKLLVVLALASASTFAQENGIDKLRALEKSDTVKLFTQDTTKMVMQDTIKTVAKPTVTESKDTTRIRLGKREIIVIEKDGNTTIEVPEGKEKYTFDSDKDKDFTYKSKRRFKGNWAGFEWGFNGFSDANYSNNMQGDLKYLEIKQGRSWNLNLNIMQYSLGFGTDKVGLVTGLGFEFNNFHFRNRNTIKSVNGITVNDDSYITDPEKSVISSKLSTTHITVPLLLEFQIPTGHSNRLFVSAGVVGGVRIGSSTRIEYEGLRDGKDKIRDDFNLTAFRYGLTSRIGFKNLSIFATYYPLQMFEKGKGPEVYPFAIGLRLINFAGS